MATTGEDTPGDERRAQQALLEAEERFRTFFDLSSVGKVMTAPDGRLVRVNKALCDMLGYSAEELQSLTFTSVTHPDDVPESVVLVRSLLAGERDAVDVEKRYLTRAGRVVWARVRVCVLRDAAGAPLHLITDILDITDRKTAEESLRLANDRLRRSEYLLNETGRMAKVGGWELDLVANRLEWTEETRRIHEVPPEFVPTVDEAIGFYHPQDRPKIASAVRRAIELAEPFDLELRLITARGRELWVHAIGHADLQDGVVARVAGTFQDFTERRRNEEEIRDLNASLESRVKERTADLAEANRELEAFSYSVSHDLRAPLRAIEGFTAKVIRDHGERLDAEGQRFLGLVRTNALRMSKLIDGLLAFKRTGHSEIRYSRLYMTAVARSAFEEVVEDPEARAKIDFRLGDLPDAEGSWSLLHHVWLNLLSNAVKFSAEAEKPVIEIEGAVEGSFAVYHVRDNGVGFDMSYADKLFGVFQRLHGVNEFEGSGVGLALAKRIVTRHGGQVWAKGAVGQGATFSFSLPVRQKAV